MTLNQTIGNLIDCLQWVNWHDWDSVVMGAAASSDRGDGLNPPGAFSLLTQGASQTAATRISVLPMVTSGYLDNTHTHDGRKPDSDSACVFVLPKTTDGWAMYP
ncbi:hypothetical protein PGTUg99_012508 [Puccinia graminis f. sp. tritici]|uniref:Uncharacterized protein n=1 Tax=Puccinia graminis f. sp. tritici TaxID=56615 RepID=A0A5B0R6W6_PUCGR|nr:hypothetical protein PGTUg99_012508 [Puccinia graminis f. sp. tritici]